MIIFTDQFIGLSICIRTAAKLIADDLGAWKGEEFSEFDVSPFRRNGGDRFGLVRFTAHEYANFEPIGLMKVACQEIENAMVRTVALNQIKPLQVSRQLTGELKPEKTFLALTDVFEWCEIVGFDVGESLFEYLEAEQNLRTYMNIQTHQERFKLENCTELSQSRKSSDQLSAEEINRIILENHRLREGDVEVKHLGKVMKFSPKPEKTLLTIIAALAKEAKLNLNDCSKPGKAAGYIEGLTAEIGARVARRTVVEYLKKIPDALEVRRK